MKNLVRAFLIFLFLWPVAALAQYQCGTVSGCPYASAPYSGSELLYIVQNGVSKKITLSSLNTLLVSITAGSTQIFSGNLNGVLYDNGGVISTLATGNNGVFVTSGTGIPSISSTLPAAVVAAISGITGSQIAAATITGSNIAPTTITGSNLVNATITGTQIAAGTINNSNLAAMAADTIKCNNTGSSATPIDCTVSQAQTLLGISTVVSVTTYGAKGDCATDDTAAFQAAITAASGSSGFGTIKIPATTSCYLVSALNLTNLSNIVISGVGAQSLIKANGADADGNWWDFSGSNNISLRDFNVEDNGTALGILMLWACTGTSCGTSGVLNGMSISHVNINAKSTNAFFYGYGYGCASCNATTPGGGSLNISNSTWTETYNGTSGLYPTGHQNAPIVLDGQNSRSIRSVNQTLTTSAAVTWRTVITNVDFIDYSNGASQSNNAAAVFYNDNQLTVVGGSFQCVCIADIALWSNDEGLTFIQTAFEAPNGAAAAAEYWVSMGGGLNGYITFLTPFWSAPAGGFIALETATNATTGGVDNLTILGSDVGLNSSSVAFITTNASGCAPFTASNVWILNSNINFITGANSVSSCGSIDAHTIFQNAGTVTVAAGGTDNSHHF
jgi:hypothetical protein